MVEPLSPLIAGTIVMGLDLTLRMALATTGLVALALVALARRRRALALALLAGPAMVGVVVLGQNMPALAARHVRLWLMLGGAMFSAGAALRLWAGAGWTLRALVIATLAALFWQAQPFVMPGAAVERWFAPAPAPAAPASPGGPDRQG